MNFNKTIEFSHSNKEPRIILSRMLIRCTNSFMGIRINRKAISHIFILFLAMAFIIFLTFTAIAKSKTKYFIIDAELKTHLKDLARPILMKAGIPPESLQIFIIMDASI